MNRKEKLKNELRAQMAIIEKIANLATDEGRDFTEAENAELKSAQETSTRIKNQIKVLESVEAAQKDEDAKATKQCAVGDYTVQGPYSLKEIQTASRYSLMKASRDAADSRPQTGLEKEMSDQAFMDAGEKPDGNVLAFRIPLVVQQSIRTYKGATDPRNTITTTGGTGGSAGGNAVGEEMLPMQDILRDALVVRELGATVLDGLIGDATIPVPLQGTNPTYVGENGTADSASITFSQRKLTPKRLPAKLPISRMFLKQTAPSVEAMLTNIVAYQIARGIDNAALLGTGSDSQPLGIVNVTGIGSVVGGTDGATPDWADVVDLETAVATDNALIQRLGYCWNSRVRGIFKKTLKASGVAGWIQEGMTSNDYPVGVTNILPNNITKGNTSTCTYLIFGNWANLFVGLWGGMEVIADPYTNASTGIVNFNYESLSDVIVGHPESFAVMADAISGA